MSHWLCPGCQRHVPAPVDVCRCGFDRSTATTPIIEVPRRDSTEPPLQRRSRAGATVAWLLVGALVAWIGFDRFVFRDGDPESPRSERQPAAELAEQLDELERPKPTEPRELQSPAADQSTAAQAAPDAVRSTAGRSATSSTFPAPLKPAGERRLEDVIAGIFPAVVSIKTGDGSASGFFAAPGRIITAEHAVSGTAYVTVNLSDGETVPARLTRADEGADLAVLQVTRPLSSQATIPLGTVARVRVGQQVLVIGSPVGILERSVTRGIVSAIRSAGGVTYIQTDAAMNPGNSGGPVIDERGRVIGVASAKIQGAEALAFAVAIDHARGLLGTSEPGLVLAPKGGATNPPRPPARNRGLESALGSAPTTSAGDRRERGAEAFDDTVRELSLVADELDREWQRFQDLCGRQQPSSSGPSRAWLSLLDNPPEPRALSDCENWLVGIVRDAHSIDSAMQQALEDARRAGVYPGVRRDIQRKYRMVWSGWDR